MNIVLLSGGSGKRLWPLSNEIRSKQFLKLLSDANGGHESMVQRVYRQITQAGIQANIVVATSATQVESIRGQLPDDVDVVVEPERRNTFPAIVLAASYLESRKQMDPEETVIVLPVDPYVEVAYFETFQQMDARVQQGGADLVLMGIKPSYPSEKYGYIIPGEGGSVAGFKEKPSEASAKMLIEQGALWNAGVFAFKLKYLMKIADNYVDSRDFDDVVAHYESLKKDSFDYEVVEKADALAVIPYNGEWKDIGTWNTLTEEMQEESIGDVVMGEACINTHVINELSIPVVALGTQNLVIAAGQDGILVSDKHKSSYIKPYVENIDNRPMYEERRWGEYKVYDYSQYADGTKSLTKHVTINAGCAQDYHVHRYKDEVIKRRGGACGGRLPDKTVARRFHFDSEGAETRNPGISGFAAHISTDQRGQHRERHRGVRLELVRNMRGTLENRGIR